MCTEEMIQYIINELIPLGIDDLTPGRHEMGNGSYYNVDIYVPKTLENCCYESHKKYIDIQYMLEGEELVFVTDINNLQVSEPYSEQKDVTFYSGGEHIKPQVLSKGKYIVLYPQDGHMPSVRVNKNSNMVKKIVFKVKIDE